MKYILLLIVVKTFISLFFTNFSNLIIASSPPPKGFQLTDIVNQYFGKPPADKTVMNLFPSAHISYTDPPQSSEKSSGEASGSGFTNESRAKIKETIRERREYANDLGLNFGRTKSKKGRRR